MQINPPNLQWFLMHWTVKIFILSSYLNKLRLGMTKRIILYTAIRLVITVVYHSKEYKLVNLTVPFRSKKLQTSDIQGTDRQADEICQSGRRQTTSVLSGFPARRRASRTHKTQQASLEQKMFLRLSSLLVVVLSLLSLSTIVDSAKPGRKMVAGMPGSYNDVVDSEDPRVKAAGQFAFQSLATSPYPQLLSAPLSSFKIVEASQQVVAGMNYRLKIQVLNNKQECVGTFLVTVYDRFGDLSVTEWGESNIPCPPAAVTNVALGAQDATEEDPDE